MKKAAHKKTPHRESVTKGNGARRSPSRRTSFSAYTVLTTVLFFIALVLLVSAPGWQRLAGFYGLMSLIAFGLYGLDKRAARRQGWRVPEARLHVVELLGGWPGALLAQQTFRHKTRKTPFQVIFFFAVTANLAALGWLLYADAAAGLRATAGVSVRSW